MKKIILGFFIGLGLALNFSLAEECTSGAGCEKKPCDGGLRLNTNIPFIGNCIRTASGAQDKVGKEGDTTSVTQETAFPILIKALVKVLIGVIVLVAFGFIVFGGIQMTMEGATPGQFKAGKEMIIKAAVAIALIGMSGIILNAINPNFFKT